MYEDENTQVSQFHEIGITTMMSKTEYSLFLVCCLTVLSIILTFVSSNIAANTNANHHAQQRLPLMNIRIDIDGSNQPVFVTLESTTATQDFMKQLPLSLKLTDYASSEKIATLPQKLSIQGRTDGHEGRSGDITYYVPWGNLAIFYKDSDVGYAKDLIFLGKIENLPKDFSNKKELTISISQVK